MKPTLTIGIDDERINKLSRLAKRMQKKQKRYMWIKGIRCKRQQS